MPITTHRALSHRTGNAKEWTLPLDQSGRRHKQRMTHTTPTPFIYYPHHQHHPHHRSHTVTSLIVHITHMSQEEGITPLPPIEEPAVSTTQLAIRTAPGLVTEGSPMPYGRSRRTFFRRSLHLPRRRYTRVYRRRWY